MPKTPNLHTTPLPGMDRFYRACFRALLYVFALPLLLIGIALDQPGTIFAAGFTGTIAALGLAVTHTHPEGGDPHA